MSLITRLSAFFLGAIALILLGFSVGIYGLAKSYLYRQLDARLITAVETLQAAVDIESDGLDWDPKDRGLSLGTDSGPDQIRWTVSDDRGRIIDHSVNLSESLSQHRPRRGGQAHFAPRAPQSEPDPDGVENSRPLTPGPSPAREEGSVRMDANSDFPSSWQPAAWPAAATDGTAFGEAPGWRLAARRLVLQDLLRGGKGHAEDNQPDDDELPVLVLRAGVSPAPVQASLRQLALAVTLLPVGLWLGCAVIGRRICRTALKPLSHMALAARNMNADDLGERLPTPDTHDELADLGDAFNGLLSRLQEAIDRQQRFAGDASHQLRTPIAGLLSLVDVVRRRQRPAVEYEETLDRIHAEATRMRQIVESLLFLARSNADAMLLECEPLDLADWLPQQLKRWKDHARAEDLHFETLIDGPAWITAQPLLLMQLLDNLIDNACKYSSPGSPINIRLERRGGTVGLSVADQGRGVLPADLAHIFEPFYRSPESRRQGTSGVGLGLAVAQRIAVNLGGSIDVSSEPGRGSRFTAHFPALLRSAPSIATAVLPNQPAS